MNNSFLREFCESIISKHGVEGLRDITIVIPSQRIALYIKEHLLKLCGTNFWMPKILPVNLFLQELHDFAVVDELEAIFELYEAYVGVFEEPESLGDFLSWSSMILSDFNDIDKYLLDASQVFRNLQSIKDIESWSFNSNELSATQKNFMKFWEHLGMLYQTFHDKLRSRGETTNAQVYRNIAENPIEYLATIKEYVYFIGFNALSAAEETILKFLVNAGLGEVYWDTDEYYQSNPVMEAGRFIRRFETWSNENTKTSVQNLAHKPKKINLLKANSNLQQVEVASALIEDSVAGNLDNTAVVFADESLLKPMLNVLPNKLDKLNVAMGYPLSAASSFSFFEDIVQVQLNMERYRNKGYVYYKDFLQITQHEIFQIYLQERGIDLSKIHQKIIKENYSYLPFSFLEKALKNDGESIFLFQQVETLEGFMRKSMEFLKKIYGVQDINIIEKEALHCLMTALEKLLVIQEKYGRITRISTLNQLVKQLLRKEKVSFLGEPLEGIQLLGLLETRALDFQRVILLSCNEEVLPKRSFSTSLIPFDLRKYLRLPTKDDEEAIFAYYFYRLLQRAEQIDLIYDGGEPEGLRSGEISRYLIQINEELKNESVKIDHVHVATEVVSSKRISDFTAENDLLRKRIVDWLENGISASGLNQFMSCPRDFLFTQLLRLSQDEDVEEDIEASTYGTIVHEVLENLYKDGDRLITIERVDEMLNNYQSFLKNSFDKRFPGGNYLSGKNLLMYETAVHTLRKFLYSEKALIKDHGAIQIIGLEEKIEKDVSLNTTAGRINVKVKGLIDRIDKVGDKIRIIDYKTGKVERLNFKGDWDKLNRYELQLLVYLYLVDTKLDVECGIISFKQLSQKLQSLNFQGETVLSPVQFKYEFDRTFETYLLTVIEAVFESDFQHDPRSKYCKLC